MKKLTDNLILPDEYLAENVDDYKRNASAIKSGFILPYFYTYLNGIYVEKFSAKERPKEISPCFLTFKIMDDTGEDIAIWNREVNPCKILEDIGKASYGMHIKQILMKHYAEDLTEIVSASNEILKSLEKKSNRKLKNLIPAGNFSF